MISGKFADFEKKDMERFRKKLGDAISTYVVTPKHTKEYNYVKNGLMLNSKLSKTFNFINYQFDIYLTENEKYEICNYVNLSDSNKKGFLVFKTQKAIERFNYN